MNWFQRLFTGPPRPATPVQARAHENHLGTDEPLLQVLQRVIRLSVRVLALLMTGLIIMGVIDVVYELYQRMLREPQGLLTITDILATFGAFMAVLIAIEIFVNIIIYLREDVIHVKIVMATALMAIARKVIVLDFEEEGFQPEYVYGIALVVITMSVGYWLVHHAETLRGGALTVPPQRNPQHPAQQQPRSQHPHAMQSPQRPVQPQQRPGQPQPGVRHPQQPPANPDPRRQQ